MLGARDHRALLEHSPGVEVAFIRKEVFTNSVYGSGCLFSSFTVPSSITIINHPIL